MNSIAVSQSRIGRSLPDDLINYIWQFNYPYAYNIISKYTKNYIKNKINKLYTIISFIGFNSYFKTGYINYTINYNNRHLSKTDIFITCRACNCCNRHQNGKPHSMTKWIDTPLNNHRPIITCNCPCRHLSRFICRYI